MTQLDSIEREAFRKLTFKGAQNPSSWLSWAERLSDAAELIFAGEVHKEVPYFRAHAAATNEALAKACAIPNGTGSAEIQCDPPNYLPGQMLCAFALENALKGLMIAHDPSLAGETKLNRVIKNHDLLGLAEAANFSIGGDERRVLKALTDLGEWAGRYPTATTLVGHENVEPASDHHVLLDYGADHVTVRRVLKRAIGSLASAVGPKQFRYASIVIVDAPKTF